MNTTFRTHKLGVGRAVVILALATSAARPQLAMDWATTDGGGGTSTGGGYAISGTIGQPDAGRMSGGRYSLAGGFWALLGVIQTPGAPRLTISRTQGMATVSWPFPSPDFELEVTTNLSPPRQWTTVPKPYQTDGARNWVTVPATVGKQFFRLHQP